MSEFTPAMAQDYDDMVRGMSDDAARYMFLAIAVRLGVVTQTELLPRVLQMISELTDEQLWALERRANAGPPKTRPL